MFRPRNFQNLSPVQFIPRQVQRHKFKIKPATSRPSSFGRSGSVFLKKNTGDKWARAPVLKQYNPPPSSLTLTTSSTTYKPVTSKPILLTSSLSPTDIMPVTSSSSTLRSRDKDYTQSFDVEDNQNGKGFIKLKWLLLQ